MMNKDDGKDYSSTGFITERSVERLEYEKGSCCNPRSWSRTKICCVTCGSCIGIVLIEKHAAEWESRLTLDSNLNINIDGSYVLKAYDENYEPYLRSMGIPSFVVPLILRSSESINVTATEEGATMITETAWKTQEIKFEWNRVWNMTYGRNMGIMWNNCTRETQNTILCQSEEREKGWLLTSKMIFSELGMVNERYFVQENISAKKYYHKVGSQGSDPSWTTEKIEEVDIFGENDEDDDWDDWE